LPPLGRGIPPALASLVQRCLEKRREDRFRGTHDLGLALEAVLQAPSGALPEEERSPYPGLSSFKERDARVFFGREAEVRALWEKLRSRNFLAVIGPSGAGKTSFVRAGVVAHRPPGWRAFVMTPGAQPFRGLMRALGPKLAGDSEALGLLADVEEPGTAMELLARWRQGDAEGLLVVDQLEELFTQNPPVVQERFAALLGDLASRADVHVLLSLRDDFLVRCGEQEPLAPVVQDLTLLLGLKPEDLRRAIVEPARERGYAFEDDALVAEMLESAEGARGALPLLAFAVARLWDKRDRDRMLLTRVAYEEIGGVAGALAQHAEQTLERVGLETEPIVRELFRNLVTAQGTRAVAEREQLLSVFPEQEVAGQVLDQLIDARLLTSYEAVEPAQGPPAQSVGGAGLDRKVHRIEIVHESLLRAWPRLVRWQAQDEEGAVLRDQLKQAAHLWEEKGRPDDLLWTGASEREFELWQGRYPGKLTALEDEFAQVMVHRARRRKRLRRLAMASAVVGLSVVAGAIAVSRQQAVEHARRAEAEALRAEAGKLLAMGRTHLEPDGTAALAYARGSRELFDTHEARMLALEALWRGPVARVLPAERTARELGLRGDPNGIARIALSPDGRWLATLSGSNRQILLFPREGGPPRALPRGPDGNARVLAFGPRGDVLVTGGSGESLRFWSFPDLRETRRAELGGLWSEGFNFGRSLLTWTRMPEGDSDLFRSWPLPDGEPTVLGTFSYSGRWSYDPGGAAFAYGRGRTVHLRSLDPAQPFGARMLGEARDDVQDVTFAPRGDRLASLDRSGEIRLWSTAGGTKDPLRILQGPKYQFSLLQFDPEGRLLTQWGPNNGLTLWDLDGPPDPEPVVVGRLVPAPGLSGTFGPGGRWLATSYGIDTVEFWPLETPWTRAIRGLSSAIWHMAFTSDSRWLATCAWGQPARLWPMSAALGSSRDLLPAEPCVSPATHPTRGQVLVGTTRGEVLLFPTAGGPPRRLPGGWGEATQVSPVGFDPGGRRAFASPYSGGRGFSDPEDRVFRVWGLESGQERVHSVAHLTDGNWDAARHMGFAFDGSVYGPLGKGGHVVRLILPPEPGGEISSEPIVRAGSVVSSLSPDGRLLLVRASESPQSHNMDFEELLLFDLERHTSRRITTHGTRLSTAARIDLSGRVIVTGDVDGVVRVGPVTGQEPHLLLGHEGMILSVAVSPDGRWIASVSEESIRLWPMPDVSRPPLHTLPHAELMAKLDTLTNLHVVRDSTSSNGWKLEVGPFSGWNDVPTW